MPTSEPATKPPVAAQPVQRRRHDAGSLLDVAVTLFTERGYDGTSMGDLAAAAGLSKSTLYHHVPSKEQLLRLALDRAVDPLFAVTRERSAVEGRAIDRLEHVVRREVQVLVEHLPFVTLLLRVHGNTETERWALGRRKDFDHFVAALMAEAVREGDVRADVDAALVTRLLFGMVNSLVEWYRPPVAGVRGRRPGLRPATAEDLAETVVRLAFEGLRR